MPGGDRVCKADTTSPIDLQGNKLNGDDSSVNSQV